MRSRVVGVELAILGHCCSGGLWSILTCLLIWAEARVWPNQLVVNGLWVETNPDLDPTDSSSSPNFQHFSDSISIEIKSLRYQFVENKFALILIC